ncbi:MAG: hypothetical protein AAFQ98_08120 [Bacteroidota bacterium]
MKRNLVYALALCVIGASCTTPTEEPTMEGLVSGLNSIQAPSSAVTTNSVAKNRTVSMLVHTSVAGVNLGDLANGETPSSLYSRDLANSAMSAANMTTTNKYAAGCETIEVDKSRLMEASSVANRANPYDQIGQDYVDLLNHAVPTKEAIMQGGAFSVDVWEGSVNNFFGKQGLSAKSLPAAVLIQEIQPQLDFVEKKEAGQVNGDLFNVMGSYFEVLASVPSVEEFTAYSKQFEQTIIESSLSDNQRAQVLKACAIGRYSLAYWDSRIM